VSALGKDERSAASLQTCDHDAPASEPYDCAVVQGDLDDPIALQAIEKCWSFEATNVLLTRVQKWSTLKA
jgi:hypothetical protein